MSRKKKNREPVELLIESIAFEGKSVAKKDGMVYFLRGAVPGDKVSAIVTRKKKNFAEALLVEVLESSADRIEPKCIHFGDCGGCSWQFMSYENQLSWKTKHIKDAFERIGKVTSTDYKEILPSPMVFGYRNKMEFSFGASRWLTKSEIDSEEDIEDKGFAFGLHIPGRYDKILNIDYCHLQGDTANRIFNQVAEKAKELELKAHNHADHTGFLKNLAIRSNKSGDFMIIPIVNTPESDPEFEFIDWCNGELFDSYDEIKSVIVAVNDTISPVASGRIEKFAGEEYLTEDILGIKYQISPFSFFQTNSYQLDPFIKKIIDLAELNENDVVWDLYCGTGSITLPAAKRVKNIFGIELVESSVEDATVNKKINHIDNVEFFCADLHAKNTPELLAGLPIPDKIIIDPPRAGMHPNLLESIKELEVPLIVYVSCNPATQARDCELLSNKYKVELVQPVDMFPHTYHVESIAVLRRK